MTLSTSRGELITSLIAPSVARRATTVSVGPALPIADKPTEKWDDAEQMYHKRNEVKK